jgi:hypothetical protein
MRGFLPLTEGQPVAVQIRSRRICPLQQAMQLEIHWVYVIVFLFNIMILKS